MPANVCCQELTEVKFFAFFLPFTFFFHFSSFHSVFFVRAALGPSAGSDWQLYDMRGTGGTPPFICYYYFRTMKKEGRWDVRPGSWREYFRETSRGAKNWGQRTRFQKQSGGVFSLLSSSFSFSTLFFNVGLNPFHKILGACW